MLFNPTPPLRASVLVGRVETTANGGSDVTAIAGRLDMPFATLQAAYTAGVRHFVLGVGNFGTLTVTGSPSLYFEGQGTPSVVGAVVATSGNLNIFDVKGRSVVFSNINASGSDGVAPGSAGNSAGSVLLIGVKAGTVAANGGNGASGAEPSGDGGNGGNSNSITLDYGCQVGALVANGGTGGDAASGGTNGGSGGSGGAILVKFSDCEGVIAEVRGGPSGAGGGSGVGGNGGTTSTKNSVIGELIATEGAGGVPGSHDAEFSIIGVSPAELLTFRACIVAGVFQAS